MTKTRQEIILEREKRWRKVLWRLFPAYRFSNTLSESLIAAQLDRGRIWVDMGCGKGELIRELDRDDLLSVGLDREIYPDKLAQKAFPLIKADAAHLPFMNDSIELISGNMMLEHLPDPRSAFKETLRVLKPGGWMIQRTPNACHPLVAVARLIPQEIKKRLLKAAFGVPPGEIFPAFYRANRRWSLRRLLNEVGFAEVRILATEDVHTAYGIFFWFSLAYYLLVRIPVLSLMRTTLVIIAQKQAEG